MSGAFGLSAIETELKSFAVRGIRLEFGDSADLVGVWSAQRPRSADLSAAYLRRFGVEQVRLDQRPMRWTAAEAVIDSDEVEQVRTAAGAVQVAVRHSFVPAWRTRLVVTNLSSTTRTAVVDLGIEPGESCRARLLASAGESTFAVVPVRADEPILTATIRAAAVASNPSGGLSLGPVSLDPGDRFVVAWDWRSVGRLQQVAARLPAELSRWLTAEVGEEIWLPIDPDAAVVAPPEVDVADEHDRLSLSAVEPGHHRVEIRSARGSTVLEVTWATPLPDFLSAVAERLLAEEPGPRGVVRLPDLASALVVQRAVRTSGFSAATAASDALDLFTARMVDAGPTGGGAPAWAVIYLTGEYNRLGDPDLLTETDRWLTAATTVSPGLGLATVRAGFAATVAERPPTLPPVLPLSGVGSTGWEVSGAAAALEMWLATESPEGLATNAAIGELAYRLGVEIAAGPPGRVPAGLADGDLGHCLAVLQLMPESWQRWWSMHFGIPIDELVHIRALELVDRLDGTPVADGHAWLTLLSTS